jgi:CPA1 family monovalent cation:H+ antiporter
MTYHTTTLILLLLMAALVALLSSKFKLPYTLGLLISGVLLGLSPLKITIPFNHDLLFNLLLPPLIFEAAFALPWAALKKDLFLILTLATLGVFLSALVTTLGMHYAIGWAWSSASLFGILIAATDPVSVIALFKELNITGRLRVLIEAESLMNDATVAVAFSIATGLLKGVDFTAFGMLTALALNAFGGILTGAALALILLYLAGKTDNHLVEITFTMVAAFGAFSLAESFHCSGVLASLTAGLIIGNFGALGSLTDKGHEAVEAFWEYLAFVSNALVFVLMGEQLTHQDFSGVLNVALFAIILVLFSRAVAIYPLCALFAKSRFSLPWRHQHLLWWGGLRGALCLALVMSLPQALPHRHQMITVAFVVAIFSVVVQGSSMGAYIKSPEKAS